VDFLRAAVEAEAPGLQFIQRLENPESFADIAPDRSLKALVYRAA
jgi:23S rRNA (cytosine1962-C5)-methyltransferase